MDLATFKGYKRLDRKKKEIRILTLRGSTDSSDANLEGITCSLEHVQLDEANPFYALSYVWGPASDSDLIDLDGQAVLIRKNLWQFLQQLCKRFSALRVWLDYICINQQDIEERNYQVSMMDQIYRSADSVYAWIGPSTEESSNFFKSVQSVAQLRDMSLRNPEDHNPYQTLMSAYQDIARRTYWTRLWIIQEFVLARNLWLFCGAQVTNWKHFQYAVTLHADHLRSMRVKHAPNAASMHSLLRSRPLKQMDSLSDLVTKFKSSQCQDSRDRIFGLLSLADEAEASSVTVDYKKPLLQLLLDTCTLWSPELANDLAEGKAQWRGISDKSQERLEWSSVSVFCNAILGMMTAQDLDHLQGSDESQRTVTTKCAFTSSSPPRRVYKSCTLAAVTEDGLVAIGSMCAEAQLLGYVSALKDDPARSNWLFAFTNEPVTEDDMFITIGDRTMLVSDQDRSERLSPSVSAKASSVSPVVARGILIEPSHLSCCTRTLQLPQPSQLLGQFLPHADYSLEINMADGLRDRKVHGRLKVELNTAALVTLLMTYRNTLSAQAQRAREGKSLLEGSSLYGQSSHESATWSPWDFGLKHHLLRPCLGCKLNSHRAEGLRHQMKGGLQPALHTPCECEWETKAWSQSL